MPEAWHETPMLKILPINSRSDFEFWRPLHTSGFPGKLFFNLEIINGKSRWEKRRHK
jgi:hypothetical protein